MNLINAIGKLRCERWFKSSAENVRIAKRLDELIGHTKLLEACEKVVQHETPCLGETVLHICRLCKQHKEHHNHCPVRLCEAAVADADKE